MVRIGSVTLKWSSPAGTVQCGALEQGRHQAGTPLSLARRSRSSVAYPTPSRRAASDLLMRPASSSLRSSVHRSSNPGRIVTGGRPMCLPCRLALSIPAFVRSERMPRSNCA